MENLTNISIELNQQFNTKEEAIENLKKELAYYFDEIHVLEEMLYETDLLDNDIVEVDCLGRQI